MTEHFGIGGYMAGRVVKTELRVVNDDGIIGIHEVNFDQDDEMEIMCRPVIMSARTPAKLKLLLDAAQDALRKPKINLTTVGKPVELCKKLIGASVHTEVLCNKPAGHCYPCENEYRQTS